MTVQELINLLEDFSPSAEVRLAIQPTWSFEHRIGEVVEVSSNEDELEIVQDALLTGNMTKEERAEAEEELKRLEDQQTTVVYIGEGGQIGYLPGFAVNELGWR